MANAIAIRPDGDKLALYLAGVKVGEAQHMTEGTSIDQDHNVLVVTAKFIVNARKK